MIHHGQRRVTLSNRHDECRGQGLTSVVGFRVADLTWDSMTLGRTSVVLSFDNLKSTIRWHWKLTSWGLKGQTVSLNNGGSQRAGPAILVEGDFDSTKLMRRVREELGVGGSSSSYDPSHVLTQEMAMRCRCAQGVMYLNSLIPTLPRDVEQDLSIYHVDSDDRLLLCVETPHDGMIYQVSLSGFVDVTQFLTRVPAVRWDKLDFILETFHVPPALVGG